MIRPVTIYTGAPSKTLQTPISRKSGVDSLLSITCGPSTQLISVVPPPIFVRPIICSNLSYDSGRDRVYFNETDFKVITPQEVFGVYVDLGGAAIDCYKEIFGKNPIICIKGSYLYAHDNYDVIGDFDFVIFHDGNTPIIHELNEKEHKGAYHTFIFRLKERLKEKGLEVVLDNSKHSGEFNIFIVDKNGKRYELNFVDLVEDRKLIEKNRNNEPRFPNRGELAASNLTGKIFFGNIERLNALMATVSKKDLLDAALDHYFTLAGDVSKFRFLKVGGHVKALKRMYYLAFLRGLEENFEWLLSCWNKYKDSFDYDKYFELCRQYGPKLWHEAGQDKELTYDILRSLGYTEIADAYQICHSLIGIEDNQSNRMVVASDIERRWIR